MALQESEDTETQNAGKCRLAQILIAADVARPITALDWSVGRVWAAESTHLLQRR